MTGVRESISRSRKNGTSYYLLDFFMADALQIAYEVAIYGIGYQQVA